jgi:hypothetical protein
MKTMLLSSVAFAMVIILADASAQPPLAWEQTYGGPETDYCYSVHPTTEEYIYVKGFTESSGAGQMDLYLVKTDSLGNELWHRAYGGPLMEYSCHKTFQNQGNSIILAGYTESFSIGHFDFYLVKTDLDGNELWSHNYGTVNNDQCYGVTQTNDGGYIMVGYTYGTNEHDVYVIKVDSMGVEEWSQIYGYSDSELCYHAQQTSDGGYIFAGYTRSLGYADDGYLLKTDSLGNVEWDQHYAGHSWDYFFEVWETLDGGYVASGYTDIYSGGSAQMWAVKTDALGNEIWNHSYGGGAEDRCYSLQLSPDGGYYLCGGTMATASGLYDIWIVKIDSDGNKVWDTTYGDDADELCRSLIRTEDGGFLIGGYKQPSGSDNQAYLARLPGEIPDLTLSLTPHNPPIQIPAGGGEFQFDIEIVQSNLGWCTCDICIDVTLPGGTTLFILQRDDIAFAPEQTISRQDLTQQVPGTAPAGTYTYHAYAWDAATWTIYAEDFFTFEKLDGGDGLIPEAGWTLSGWDETSPRVETVAPTYFVMNSYPNPFNPSTVISYQVSEVSQVNLAIYDISGRQVAELVNAWRNAGNHHVTFDASSLPSGVYFARLTSGEIQSTQKLLLVK